MSLPTKLFFCRNDGCQLLKSCIFVDRFNLYLLLTMKNVKFFALLLCAVSLVGCSSLLGDNNDDPSVKPEDVGYFSIEIDDVSAHSATVSVTASDNLPVDWIWDVAESDEVINEEYVEAYLLEYYAVQLEQFGATEAEYPFSKFLLEVGLKAGVEDTYVFKNRLSPNTVYKVWACGLDEDDNAIYIQTKTFKTPVLATDVKGDFQFNVNSSAEGTTITVTPPSDLTTKWYWDIYEMDGRGVDAELVSWILNEYLRLYIEAGKLAQGATITDLVKLIGIDARSSDSFTFEDLEAGEYNVWACGLDANGNVATKIDVDTFTVSGGSGSGGDDGGVMTGTAKIEEVYSTLTSNVSFTAEEAHMDNYGSYWDDYGMSSLFGHEDFYIELYGPYVGEDYEWMVLELLAPAGATSPEGTYTVGYSGNHIALSSVYVDCGNEDDSFYAGCCYGFGETDYADFESGTVTVTKSGSGYNVTVDAKCGAHTIKMTYTGELAPFDNSDTYGQSPKLHKYHTKSHRQTVGKERRMSR